MLPVVLGEVHEVFEQACIYSDSHLLLLVLQGLPTRVLPVAQEYIESFCCQYGRELSADDWKGTSSDSYLRYICSSLF